MSELITRRQLAQKWQCTPRHISHLVATGEIPAVRLGTLLRFDIDEIDALIERSTTIASRPAGERALDDLAAANQKRRAKKTDDLAPPPRPQPVRRPAAAKVRR